MTAALAKSEMHNSAQSVRPAARWRYGKRAILMAGVFLPALAASGARAQTLTAAQNLSSGWVYSQGSTARTLHQRATDIYNVRDYGATGNNTSTTLGATFPAAALASLNAFATQWVSGEQAYAWMRNPAFGLTFSIPTSTSQGTRGNTLTFLESLSGMNGWSATVAAWQDPAHGNYLLQPGMLVTGSCIAADTTVTAVGRTPGAADYGTVTLSQSTSGFCGSGIAITFTVASAQLQSLTTDWLGIQSTMAAAWMNTQSGGSVYLPGGTYNINHSLINAGGVTDTSVETPNLDIHGDGLAETRIAFVNDIGQDECAISEATRGGPSTSMSTYHDLRLIGPSNWTRVEGAAPNEMDGLCIGESAKIFNVLISNMHAGVNGLKDHWSVRDSNLTNNGYGVYFAPYSSTLGNQSIIDSALASNTIASIGVAATNQVDSATITDVHTGFSPYGFYREPVKSNVKNPLGFLSNSVLTDVWAEALGNAWIYGSGKLGDIVSNVFLGGGYPDVGSQKGYAIPNGQGGVVPAPAVIFVGNFIDNTMEETNWADYNNVSDAIVEASGSCTNNIWLGDTGFVFNTSTSVRSMICPNGLNQDRFLTGVGDGLFRFVNGSVSAGVAVSDIGEFQVQPFSDGRDFAGITASPAPAGGVVGVVSFSDNLSFVVKADPNQSISNGQPIFATTGGVAGGIDQEGAVGTAYYSSPSGSQTVRVDLDPGMKGGATGSAVNLTSAGNNQSTAYPLTSTVSEFASVPPGSGTILSIIPVGRAITVFNDSSNSLEVFPQLGGVIGNGLVNAGVSLGPQTSATFRRISKTLWHQ